MARLLKESFTVATTGSNEAATGEATFNLRGLRRVVAIGLEYSSQPATTDVTITDGGNVLNALLAKSNSAANKLFYLAAPAAKTADGSASTVTEVLPVAESIKAVVAQGNAASPALTITVYTETV